MSFHSWLLQCGSQHLTHITLAILAFHSLIIYPQPCLLLHSSPVWNCKIIYQSGRPSPLYRIQCIFLSSHQPLLGTWWIWKFLYPAFIDLLVLSLLVAMHKLESIVVWERHWEVGNTIHFVSFNYFILSISCVYVILPNLNYCISKLLANKNSWENQLWNKNVSNHYLTAFGKLLIILFFHFFF